MDIKKRKRGDVDEEGISERKKKVSGFAEEKQNINKPIELVRTVKSLLQKEQTRLAGLKKLLNALKESHNKESVESIVKEGGEFLEVFKILEGGRHNLSQLEIQTCLEILENILLFTAEENQLASRTGMSIVQRVLQGHMKLMYSCLNPGNPPGVIKAALRLLTTMVTQGPSAAREVQRSFDFTLKSLSSLPNKRDSKSAQDVRTCFIYFCLSFLMFGDLAVMKQILELKGFLQSVMKGLQFDTPDVVHAVLSTLQVRVAQNSGITKKSKVQFFNSYVLSQLANLYQYTKDAEEENNKSDQTVRRKVHDLLLKICGSFKLGICFSNTAGAFAMRSNNPVLLKFLQSLSSVMTDVLIQDLVITVLCCCQDVTKPFLSSLTVTYEPRLSMPWITNMNLLTKIYMALPQPSQMLEKSGLKLTTEILPSLINMVVPVGINRTGLSRGVQHASSLVKHTTLSLVVVILNRAQDAAGCLAFRGDAAQNHENTNVQSEAPLLQQFREEVIKALPDVKTIISLRQNLVSGKAKGEALEEVASPTVLLAQSLKVIHGFQMLWLSVLSHVDFDLRKLLPGQQEITLPPIAQQLTLQILLQAPPMSLKWYQQKGKSSTSFVYSILNLYTSVRSENIKNDAKQLLWKLLSETGLVSSHPCTNEVEIWLSHLCHSQMYEGHRETLLRFLDEVFTAVAAEPYEYTDIVIDMQAEAVAQQASAVQLGVESTEWNWSSDASLPMSLLLVGALKQYSQMVSMVTKPAAAVGSLGCVAQYMNCVIFDMIHSALNPAILCFVVSHYYANTEVPEHLTAIRSVHKSLLQYVSNWLPGPVQLQDNSGYLKETPKGSGNSLKELRSFLDRTTVHSEQEKVAALADLYCHLESLNEAQLRTVMVDCVGFCKHQLSEDFSPLVQVLQVKNYKITGPTATENIAPLLQALPFSALMWQVLGDTIQGTATTPQGTQLLSSPEKSSLENNISIPLHNSWTQTLLMAALEKEPSVKTVPLCCHLLLYLHSLKTKLVTIRCAAEQGRLQSAIQLCFQLLQYLLQKLVLPQQKINKDKTNAVEEMHNEKHLYTGVDSYKPDKQGLYHVEDMCRTVLHHPVILNSFLWKSGQLLSHRVSQDVGVELTYNVANLLLAVLPSLKSQQKKILMSPFVSKLCNAGMLEIQTAQDTNVVPSSQALYLLGLFHDYCDKEHQVEFVSTLAQLPSNSLVSTNPVSKETEPSVFLVTLLMLLEGESLGEDNLSHASSAFLRDLPLKTEEPLSVSHFKQLIKISVGVNCSQLDSTILNLLQKSLLYVLASTTTLLDACLENPTEAKVAVAAHLVKHSPALRSHFELCCLSRPNTKKMKACGKTVVIAFGNHLIEYLPLVSSYLVCIQGMKSETLDKTRTQAVVSHLVEVYWTPLWDWLVGDRGEIFKNSEELCMELLAALIQTMQQTDGSLSKKLNELLMKASLWDSCQLRICHQLVTSLCRDVSATEQRVDVMSKFCFACMEFFSSVLIGRDCKKDNEQVMEDTLIYIESICKNEGTISAVDEGCFSAWSSFVTNSLRYEFQNTRVLRTLRCITKSLYKKQDNNKSLLPLDTLYEMVLSHSQFLEVILGNDQESDTKETLAELMVTVVELNANCCKSSHLPVLFAAYSASLSIADQSILYLLNLYEKNHASFKNYRPFLWGPAAANHHQTAKSLGPSLWQQPSVSEVLEQVDASKMYQSAVVFPQSRLLQPQVQSELSRQTLQDVYDPCFLLPLFSCLLAPNYQVDCRKFVEQGCLSFAVASLSSRDVHVRQAGYHVLSRYMMHLEGARFKERKQISHLLTCLKNGITEADCRLSSLMVCFIARVAHILLKPEHPFYIMMNSLLLQRPALDLRDLPLFYTMFNSSTMQHVTERSWMLQLLVDGMKDSPDYYLYKRRHVIELALSYHDSPVSDHHSQNLVTQLLLSALKIHPAAYDLTKNYGIVAWIHSLCYKSPERLVISLNLLQTLWFTLHATSKSSKDEEEKSVCLPPNLAQECALVCWTLLEQLRSSPGASDTYKYLQLLASIIPYLAANEQPSGLSCDRILSLLCLWCAAFEETVVLSQLLSPLNLNEMLSSAGQTYAPRTDCEYIKLKTESLSSLLALLASWQPSGVGTNQTSLQQIVLVVWHFGLICCRDDSSMINKLDNDCPPRRERQSPVCLLSLLRWFRKCLVKDRALQDHLVTESPASELKLLLQLYQVSLRSNMATDSHSLQHIELKTRVHKNYRLAIIRELNMMCLVLVAAAQRVKRQGDEEGSLQETAPCLISQKPYVEVISKGLETVILPLLPNPSTDMEEESCQGKDVILQELVSLFVQELWLGRPVPRQFFSFLLSHGDSGYPVVDSIVLALGGTKVITKWIQKDV